MSRSAETGGVSLLTVALVVFVILKLTDNINWSWFWVLSPWTIPLSLLGIVLGCVGVIWFLGLPVRLIRNRKRRDDPENVMKWR